MKAVVPAYFHPAVAAADWQALAAAGPGVRAVVFNVDSGPGQAPELELRAVGAHIDVPLLGYVDLAYGERPASAVATDLARYQAWYPTTGIFFDRVGGGRRTLAQCAAAVAAARRHGAAVVALNHGAHPDPAYATFADALVTFEGPASAHRLVDPPRWVRDWPADKFWHLVYDVPGARARDVLAHAAASHAGVCYVTDRGGDNPWDGLPSYFPAWQPTAGCGAPVAG
jgi:hypothetical protein